MWLPSSGLVWAYQLSNYMKRDNLPPKNLTDESTIVDKILLWPLTSLCLWDTPCPQWSWRGGTRKGVAFLDLVSTVEKWRGRWCLWSYHYPQRFSWYWILLLWAWWSRGRYEAASLLKHLLQRKKCSCQFVSASRGYSVDAVHLPLIWFIERSERPSCGWLACDRLYLPDHAWRMLGRMVLVP